MQGKEKRIWRLITVFLLKIREMERENKIDSEKWSECVKLHCLCSVLYSLYAMGTTLKI